MSELRSSRVDSETASFSLELGRLAMQLCWSRDVLVLLFYRTQVSLGSGLWVPVSLSISDSFVKLY